MNKTLLSTLDITALPISNLKDPVVLRQNKLIKHLEEQREFARCELENEVFTAYREKMYSDEHGNKTRVKQVKKLRPWFYSIKGNYFLEVRYASKALELAKNKFAISVGTKEQLLKVIDTVIDAVKAGELDQQLLSIKRPLPKNNL